MSTLTDQGLAALDRDPAAIRDAAHGLTACAGPVADEGAHVARTWRGCAPFYVAPESPVLVAALDPVVTDTQAASDRLAGAGRILARYADRIEPILAQIKAILAFQGPLDAATAAAAEQRLNGLLAELSALDLDCAGAIRALTGAGSFNPVPPRIKTGETTVKSGAEITIGVIKIGENLAVVETRFSDGRVMFTLTDGGQVSATVGLGEKAAAGPYGLTGKLEIAPGVTVENGSSWIVPGDQADAFRERFRQYAYRHAAAISPDESVAWGAQVADVIDPLPSLPPPDLVVTNVEVPAELKGTLDAAPPGPIDVAAAGVAGLTGRWAQVRLKDGSVVSTFGGDGSLAGDAKVYRDDTDPAFGGNADGKSVDGGAAAVTRDPGGRITKVVLTSTEEVQTGLGDQAGSGSADPSDGPKAGASGSQQSSTVDLTTTTLAVDNKNRAVVEQWVAQHQNDATVALGSESTFRPETAAPHDPFQNVLHTDAQVTTVRYENVTDKVAFGAEASLGVTVGAEVSGEGTESHAVSGTYLDAPDIDGRRPARPLPKVGG